MSKFYVVIADNHFNILEKRYKDISDAMSDAEMNCRRFDDTYYVAEVNIVKKVNVAGQIPVKWEDR